MVRIITGILLITISVTTLMKAQDNSIELSEAIELTIQKHLEIQAADMSVKLSELTAKNQKWSRWPSVQVQLAPNNTISNSNAPTSVIQGAVRNLTLGGVANLEWVVFEGYKQKYAQERVDQEVEIQKLTKYLKVEEKIQAVMQAYFSALIAKEETAVFKETLDRSRRRYESITNQVNLGYQSDYDALRYRSRMFNDSIDYVRAVNNYENSIIELNRTIGNNDIVDYEIDEDTDLPFNVFSENRMLQQLVRDNNQLYLNSLVLDQKGIEENEIRSGMYPRMSLTSSWNASFNRTKVEEFPLSNGNNNNLTYGISISQVLFNQRAIKNALENNHLERAKMSVELAGLETELSNTVSKLIQEHNAKIELLNLQEEVLDNLNRNIALEEDRYNNGLSSLLDYNIVQQEYTTALRTKLRTIFDILLLNSRVLRLTGGLRKYYDYGG